VGEYGLWLASGSQDITIEKCHIHDLGAGGIKMGEMFDASSDATAVRDNVIDNCFTHNGGHVFPVGSVYGSGATAICLRPDTPAEIIDFQPIDINRIGLYGPDEWYSMPEKIEHEPFDVLPDSTHSLFPHDDFEDTDIGDIPKGATISGEEAGASIRVTDEVAATGKHSLRFSDASGLEHVWRPHMYYNYAPSIKEGVLRLAFDARMEAGAVLEHEWRDWSREPYISGPSIQIRNGWLKACSKITKLRLDTRRDHL